MRKLIQINNLTEKDVGRWVTYVDGVGKKEEGKLKSWNDTFIFVVYTCNNEWDRFKDFTGAATSPKDLYFKEDPKLYKIDSWSDPEDLSFKNTHLGEWPK